MNKVITPLFFITGQSNQHNLTICTAYMLCHFPIVSRKTKQDNSTDTGKIYNIVYVLKKSNDQVVKMFLNQMFGGENKEELEFYLWIKFSTQRKPLVIMLPGETISRLPYFPPLLQLSYKANFFIEKGIFYNKLKQQLLRGRISSSTLTSQFTTNEGNVFLFLKDSSTDQMCQTKIVGYYSINILLNK